MAQLNLLYSNMPISLMASLLIALMLVAGLWPVIEHGVAVTWLGTIVAVLALRLFVFLHQRNRLLDPGELDRARYMFFFTILLAGIAWGGAAFLLFPADEPVYQAYLGLTFAGLSAGAVASLSASRSASLGFLVPTLVPLAAQFLRGDTRISMFLGAMTVLFLMFVLFGSRRIGSMLKDNQLLQFEVEDRGAKLSESMAELSAIFDSVNQFLVLLDTEGRILRCNRTATLMLGQSDHWEGRLLSEVAWWPEADRVRIAEEIEFAAAAQCVRREQLITRPDGRNTVLDFSLSPVLTPEYETLMIVATAIDITKRITAERVLESSERKFRNLVERSLAGVYIIDAGRFSYANPMLAEIFGYTPEEIMGDLTVLDLVYQPDQELVAHNLKKPTHGDAQGLRYQFRGLRKDGQVIHVEVLGTYAEINGRDVVIGTLLDITDHKVNQKRIEELANFDELTGLHNRRMLMEAAREAVDRALERGEPLCVLYLDLDRFKNVNDTLGHDTGDQLLIDVANRLRACLRGTDSLARLGGDEFAFVLPGASPEVAEKVARRVVRTVGEPFHVAGHNIRVGGSVGIATLSESDASAASLFKQADIAMYCAKRERGSYAFFEQGQEQEVKTRLALETELAKAVDRSEFHLVYQPRVNLVSGHCQSVEALIRWNHPRRGMISPADFIPIAEETGLIVQIGEWVMQEALAQQRKWADAGLELRMGINVSLREIHDVQLVSRLQGILEVHRVSGQWVELEITESAAMTEPEESINTLRRLNEMGIALSIDDFGTGYSSLNHLKRLPADFLKIDQSFVGGIGKGTAEGTVDEGIVRVIVALANSLGIEVIAEGVEKEEQLRFLVAEGCHYAQGYYLAKPMLPDDLYDLLSDQARLNALTLQ